MDQGTKYRFDVRPPSHIDAVFFINDIERESKYNHMSLSLKSVSKKINNNSTRILNYIVDCLHFISSKDSLSELYGPAKVSKEKSA